MKTKRTPPFSRNENLESLLRDLNSKLWPAEKQELQKYKKPALPLILIMAPLRSGTTLFMQWLAETGLVAYPTNFLSRFFLAPVLGARIQLMLTDPAYDFRGELHDFVRPVRYSSANGKTSGVLAPNEFWYFWRRFLPDPAREIFTNNELERRFDSKTMLAELAGLMRVLGKPFAAKGMLFNYNIPFLRKILDKVVFIHIQRDLAANAESVLRARKRQYGSRTAWYSFKIPEFDILRKLSPEEQAVGQVFYANRAIFNGLAKVRQDQKINVRYEDFCADPKRIFGKLTACLRAQGYDSKDVYSGPKRFEVRLHRISPAIRAACARIKGKKFNAES